MSDTPKKKSRSHWLTTEKNLVKTLFDQGWPDEAIAQVLPRTADAIGQKRAELGKINQPREKRVEWYAKAAAIMMEDENKDGQLPLLPAQYAKIGCTKDVVKAALAAFEPGVAESTIAGFDVMLDPDQKVVVTFKHVARPPRLCKCSFCGTQPKIGGILSAGTFTVRCPECGTCGPAMENHPNAITAWNKIHKED